MQPLHIVLAVLVQLGFAVQVIAIKIGVTQFPPIFMVALRFLLMTLILVPIVKRPMNQLKPVLAITLTLNILHFGLFYAGIKAVDASIAAILYQLSTPLAALLSFFLLRERLGWRGVGGIALALAGVVIVAGAPSHHSAISSILLITAGTFSFAIGNVLVRRLGPFDPMMLNGWAACFTTPALLALSLLMEHGQEQSLFTANAYGWTALVYTALGGGILVFGIWYFLLGRYPVTQVMPYLMLAPIFTVVLSILLLHEPLTLRLLVGGTIAILGVAIVQFNQNPPLVENNR